MNQIKIFQKQLSLILVFCFGLSFFLYAQPDLPILAPEYSVSVRTGLEIIPESRQGKKYYYLPDQLQLKKNEAGLPMLSMIKYTGEGKSGTILNAQFTFEPESASTEIQDALKLYQEGSYYAGPYPFYYHEKFYGKFENAELIIELTDGKDRTEIGKYKATLNNSGLIMSLKLPEDQSDLIWQSLMQNKGQSIHFRVKTEVKSLERNGELSISFSPWQLKEHLSSTIGHTNLNQHDFEACIDSIIDEGNEDLIRITGNTEAYSHEQLVELVVDRVGEIIFEASEENIIKNSSTSYANSKTTRRIIINGKVVEETQTESSVGNPEPGTSLKFKADDHLSETVNKYQLGEQRVVNQPHQLIFDLSDFYQRNFRNN